MLNMNKIGFFPYAGDQMQRGLAAGIDMLHEEGLDNVFARHHASPRRRGVRCAAGARDHVPGAEMYSPTITAVMLPEGHDADAFRNWRSTPSTFPTARASDAIPANISASATSATSTTAT